MDSFEARLQFIQVIKNLHKTLNTSKETSPTNVTNQQQTDPVQFYLKHYEHHYEDFHQCLLDYTAKMDSLDRLNVLIYWSRLVSSLWPRCMRDVNGEENIAGKVVHNYLLKQLHQILVLMIPENDWKSLVNLSICIDIFLYLNDMCGVYTEQNLKLLTCDREMVISSFDGPLKDALQKKSLDVSWYEPPEAQNYTESFSHALQFLVSRRKLALFLQEYYRLYGSASVSLSTSNSTILHRMENDRERHKKSKEHLWFINRDFILDQQEFDALWAANRQGMTRDDYNNIKELKEIAQNSYMYA